MSGLSRKSIGTDAKCFAAGLETSRYCTKSVLLGSASGVHVHARCPTFSFILSVVPPCHMTIFERVSNTTPDVSAEEHRKKKDLETHLQTLLKDICKTKRPADKFGVNKPPKWPPATGVGLKDEGSEDSGAEAEGQTLLFKNK